MITMKANKNINYFLLPTLRGILGLYAAYVTEYQHDTMFRPVHMVLMFENGYGASIVPNGYSGKMWEIGVIDSNGDLCYTTPVTNDVIRWAGVDQLHRVLADIYRLPKAK